MSDIIFHCNILLSFLISRNLFHLSPVHFQFIHWKHSYANTNRLEELKSLPTFIRSLREYDLTSELCMYKPNTIEDQPERLPDHH